MTFESLDLTVTLPIGITVNSLIVLKSFLDPIIYTARMKDFKVAFHRMRYQVLSKCFPRCRWWGGGGAAGGGQVGGGDDDGTMVHFNRSLLLGNNSVANSTIHHHPSARRSTRFGQSKINRANSQAVDGVASAAANARQPVLSCAVDQSDGLHQEQQQPVDS